MSKRPSSATIVAACTQRIRSLGSYVDGGAQIGVNGRKLAHADVVAVYRRCLDARATLARLRAQTLETLGTIAATEAERVHDLASGIGAPVLRAGA